MYISADDIDKADVVDYAYDAYGQPFLKLDVNDQAYARSSSIVRSAKSIFWLSKFKMFYMPVYVSI